MENISIDNLNNRFEYPAIFYEEFDGKYSVQFPDFDEITDGKNLQEAQYMAVEYLFAKITLDKNDHRPLPAPSTLDSISVDPDLNGMYKSHFKTIVAVDMDTFSKYMEGKQTVRTNVTMPKYLKDLATEHHINISSVVQEALKQRLNL